MMLREWLRLAVVVAVGVAVSSNALSQDDPGKDGYRPCQRHRLLCHERRRKVAGKKAAAVSKTTEIRLRGEERLRFTNYRVLGQDVQPLLRSYESWAQPLKPSDEVLVRFEARSRPTRGSHLPGSGVLVQPEKSSENGRPPGGGSSSVRARSRVARRAADHRSCPCAGEGSGFIVRP